MSLVWRDSVNTVQGGKVDVTKFFYFYLRKG